MNTRPILALLADHDVHFVLVGGLAASLHALDQLRHVRQLRERGDMGDA